MPLFSFQMSVVTPRGKFTRDVHTTKSTPQYQLTGRQLVRYFVPGSRQNPFNARSSCYEPYHLGYDVKRREGVLWTGSKVSSRTVFRDSTILPYALEGGTSGCSTELDFLAAQLSGSVRVRVPAIYRISDDWVIDDLGRIYRAGPSGYTWRQYSLSGDFRNAVTLRNSDGTYLSRPAYFFAGVAGYVPRLQKHFVFSLKYDFHHIAENKLDLRPDSIVPLEVDLHRYVHSKDLSKDVKHFFRQSKQF